MAANRGAAAAAAPGDHKTLTTIDLDRVLDTAVAQFAEQGFEGVSMRELSRESHCPTPSIYYHFDSEEQSAIAKLTSTRSSRPSISSMRGSNGVRDKTRRFEVLVEAFFDLFTGDRSLLLLMQRDVIDASVARRRFLSQKQYEYFTSLIARIATEVKGAPVSLETAFTVGALIFGYCELLIVMHEIYDQRADDLRLAEKNRLVKAAVKLLSID